MLIRGNCKFLFLFPWNMLHEIYRYVTRNIPICYTKYTDMLHEIYTKYTRNKPMNVSCVRFIVKSSSCNGRDISQN